MDGEHHNSVDAKPGRRMGLTLGQCCHTLGVIGCRATFILAVESRVFHRVPV